jgi:hypothetical protein
VDTYARERGGKRRRFAPGDPRSRDDLGALVQGKGPDARAPRGRTVSRAASLAVRRGPAALIHRAAAVRS